ncbi:MAG: hypothetical protein IJ367_01740, partial [Clostridia bacterium]|nr:hypothetical protein [Clostridia bacterium]
MIWRLFSLQIVSGREARSIVDAKLSLSVPVTAARGDITDRFGRPLVSSRTGFFIVAEKTAQTTEIQNRALLNTLALLTEADRKEYTDRLPVSLESPYVYIKDEKTFLKKNGLHENTSAEDVIRHFCEKYCIEEKNETERRLLCGIRYGMEQDGFSATSPYTLAEDVSIETVSRLKENAGLIPSVSVYERPVREYLYPGMASHILGYAGKISGEEYENLK